jgi:hypothetical protein
MQVKEIKVITKLPNSEQSYKGKVQTHNYINRQNQSTTGTIKLSEATTNKMRVIARLKYKMFL